MQKYGYEANLALTNQQRTDFRCEICGENHGFNWSDYHGEGMCNRCGVPYQLIHYEKDEKREEKRIEKPPSINLNPQWIPICKEYWNETHCYMGLGWVMNFDWYPECKEGQEKFFAWMEENHPEMK